MSYVYITIEAINSLIRIAHFEELSLQNELAGGRGGGGVFKFLLVQN